MLVILGFLAFVQLNGSVGVQCLLSSKKTKLTFRQHFAGREMVVLCWNLNGKSVRSWRRGVLSFPCLWTFYKFRIPQPNRRKFVVSGGRSREPCSGISRRSAPVLLCYRNLDLIVPMLWLLWKFSIKNSIRKFGIVKGIVMKVPNRIPFVF